jgi:hypothetical protein
MQAVKCTTGRASTPVILETKPAFSVTVRLVQTMSPDLTERIIGTQQPSGIRQSALPFRKPPAISYLGHSKNKRGFVGQHFNTIFPRRTSHGSARYDVTGYGSENIWCRNRFKDFKECTYL